MEWEEVLNLLIEHSTDIETDQEHFDNIRNFINDANKVSEDYENLKSDYEELRGKYNKLFMKQGKITVEEPKEDEEIVIYKPEELDYFGGTE